MKGDIFFFNGTPNHLRSSMGRLFRFADAFVVLISVSSALEGAPSFRGAPVTLNGGAHSPVIFNGAPDTFRDASVVLNGVPRRGDIFRKGHGIYSG